MHFEFSKLILCVLFILLSSKIYGQKEHHFKIDMKMLQSTASLKEGSPWLKFEVTVTNMDKEDYYFGQFLKYGSKGENDYYLDATDADGKTVSFSNMPDMDNWLIDPDKPNWHKNKIVDTIYNNIWHFKKGKYKIRWVLDPANAFFNYKNPKAASTQKPIYSNWETIEIIK